MNRVRLARPAARRRPRIGDAWSMNSTGTSKTVSWLWPPLNVRAGNSSRGPYQYGVSPILDLATHRETDGSVSIAIVRSRRQNAIELTPSVETGHTAANRLFNMVTGSARKASVVSVLDIGENPSRSASHAPAMRASCEEIRLRAVVDVRAEPELSFQRETLDCYWSTIPADMRTRVDNLASACDLRLRSRRHACGSTAARGRPLPGASPRAAAAATASFRNPDLTEPG